MNNLRHHCKCQRRFAPTYSHRVGTVHSHRRNPQDALIAFYANQRNKLQVAKHTLWVVEHHPEDPIVAVTSDFFLNRENYERFKAAWEEALGTHSDSAEVLYHAGLFFESEDPQRG